MSAQEWPDAARPGVPLNPERDGWHWLENESGTAREACQWSGREWMHRTGLALAKEVAVAKWRYLGPCLTPAEVAALVAEARAAGMREAAGIAEARAAALRKIKHLRDADAVGDVAIAIRAFIPETKP